MSVIKKKSMMMMAGPRESAARLDVAVAGSRLGMVRFGLKCVARVFRADSSKGTPVEARGNVLSKPYLCIAIS